MWNLVEAGSALFSFSPGTLAQTALQSYIIRGITQWASVGVNNSMVRLSVVTVCSNSEWSLSLELILTTLRPEHLHVYN